MLSLNFGRDKKNFEKYLEAVYIYKNIARHQGVRTNGETPAQAAIRISGAELSESNFFKFIYIERISRELPENKLLSQIERQDISISRAYEFAKKAEAEEIERKRLEEAKKKKGLIDLTKTTTQNTPSTPTPVKTPTTPASHKTPVVTPPPETQTITEQEEPPRIIVLPTRRYFKLSDKCHIANESNHDLREIPDNSIDMSFQSPPYWNIVEYGNDNELGKETTPEKYLDNLLITYQKLYPKFKNSGNLLVNFKGTFSIMKHYCLEQWFVIRMSKIGWYLKDTLIWERGVGKQAGKFDRGPENCYEPIFWFVKSKDYYFAPYAKQVRDKPVECSVKEVTRNEKNGITNYQKLFVNRAIQSFVNVIHENEFWNIITTDASDIEGNYLNKYYGKHPAPFPLCLPVLPALSFCPPNGTVIDTFMGRGAGLIPSLVLGHTVYGYELNEQNFEIAKNFLTDVVSGVDVYNEIFKKAIAA
jgi:DNA modification methylase